MGLVPGFLQLLIDTHKKVNFENPLLSLGNQDVYADFNQLKALFEEENYPFQPPSQVELHSSKYFLEEMPEQTKNFVHARVFFEMLGLKEYYDLDKFEDDHPIIKHDLNLPVPQEWEQKFGLLLDSGTIEHIFDVKQVMSNIASMVKTGGWVVHITPSSNTVDHGFYSFSPGFFYDFYHANGFEDFVCYMLYLDPHDMIKLTPYFEYQYGMSFEGLNDPNKHLYIFFAARKREHLSHIEIPTQGRYNPANELINVPQNGQVDLKQDFSSKINALSNVDESNAKNLTGELITRLRQQEKLLKELDYAKNWLEEQVKSWQNETEKLQAVQSGKEWLEEQVKIWQQEAEKRDKLIKEQADWIEELQKGKDWIEGQWQNWQAAAQERQAIIDEQVAQIKVLKGETP